MNDIQEIESKLKARWSVFKKLHELILAVNPKIGFRIFPIYVSYYIGDKNAAIIYFKGDAASDNELFIGLWLEKNKKTSSIVNMKNIHHDEFNYGLKIKTTEKIENKLITAIKLIRTN